MLALPEGRNTVRWTLAVLFGLLGIAVLLVEPITWLADGGSPATYLAGATIADVALVALRVVHLAAVVVALVLMFRPAANAFFRAGRPW